MKIAIPLANGKLCLHFGHCENFALIDVDQAGKSIIRREDVDSPPHQPGLLPGWLQERGAEMVIAGGMGIRAQDFFTQMGIKVLVGASPEPPEDIVTAWLDGTLELGGNVCDH